MDQYQVSTPRVNCALLDSYVGRSVMLVGKVLQLRGDTAILDVDGNVTANLDINAHLTANNAAQIIGKVLPDLAIKVLTSRDLGPDVDYNLCRAVVEISQKMKPIFEYGGGQQQHH